MIDAYRNYMIGVALLGHVWLGLSAIKIFKTHNTEGVSTPAHFVLFAGSMSYLTYATLRDDPVVFIASMMGMLFNSIVIFAIFYVNVINKKQKVNLKSNTSSSKK
jgi:uncharacterized protein with PQ loop repeat